MPNLILKFSLMVMTSLFYERGNLHHVGSHGFLPLFANILPKPGSLRNAARTK